MFQWLGRLIANHVAEQIADEERGLVLPSVSLGGTDSLLFDMFGIRVASGGLVVTQDTAMRLATVSSCVRVLAESLAQLPVHVKRRVSEKRTETDLDHPAAMFAEQPNDYQTSFSFREMLQTHVALWGGGYAWIRFDVDTGRPRELVPLLPDRTHAQLTSERRLLYTTTVPGSSEIVTLDQDEVLHIPGLSFDGIKGWSPIALLGETVAQGQAARDMATTAYSRGYNGGWIEVPGKMSESDKQEFRRRWEASQEGISNTQKTAILQQNMKFHQLNMPLQDAQLLENRKYNRSEICGFYRVPPHMIADLERATFSNVEKLDIFFVKHTLLAWIRRWEQELNRKLLLPRERRDVFFKFNVEGLLRGDYKTRMEGNAIAVSWGLKTRNEVRAIEDDPHDDPRLDEPLTPLNMAGAEIPDDEETPDSEDTTDDAEQDQRQLARMALTPLFCDAFSRIAVRESKLVLRLLTKADSDETVFAESLAPAMEEHQRYIDRMVGPLIAAGRTLTNGHEITSEVALRDWYMRSLADDLQVAGNDGGLGGVDEFFKSRAHDGPKLGVTALSIALGIPE